MSSIVAWLAVRSLPGTQTVAGDDGAPMPQLRPRLPNRYEAEGTNSPAPAEELAHEEVRPATAPAPRPEAAVPAQEQQRRSEPEHQPKPRAAAVSLVAATEPPAPEHSAPRANSVQDADKPAEKIAPPASQMPGEKTPIDAPPRTNGAQQTAPPTTPRLAARVPPEAVQIHPAPAREAGRDGRQIPDERPANPAPRETPRPLPAPALTIAPARRPATVGSAPVIPAQADRRRAMEPDTAATAAALPRVQVTIERLEIRAATVQPPPPRRPPPRPATMSLDTYLADRGRG